MTGTRHHVFETAFGYCAAAWTGGGLVKFVLPMQTPAAVAARLRRTCPQAAERTPQGFVKSLVEAVQDYFDGGVVDFSNVPVVLEGIDPFRRALYLAMRRLGYGETTTYGALCASVGFPDAARATGTAMGRNPMPLVIPCHRVLAAGGRIGGFSAAGGIATKQKMLALENARPPNAEPAQTCFPF